MSDGTEPNRNISGEPGASEAMTFDGTETATKAGKVVERLGALYWEKTYGGREAFETLVRTILSQNTSDAASQPAHDALVERYSPAAVEDDADGSNTGTESSDADLVESLANAEQAALAETISDAGLYNQKSKRIIDIAERVREEYGGAEAFDSFVRNNSAERIRDVLLSMTGVGPKTADCVLLFAGGRDGVFPVDTHVHRIYRRLGVAAPDADHEAVRALLERDVPEEQCGFGHTASIQFGREYCTARSPACLDGPEACPLYDICDRVGIEPQTGSVVDPADETGR